MAGAEEEEQRVEEWNSQHQRSTGFDHPVPSLQSDLLPLPTKQSSAASS